MTTAIEVQGLSKRYELRHERAPQATTLAEALSQGLSRGKKLGRRRKPGRAESQEDFWALRDVSFQVRQGERLGIVGRNGAGKSTLLKVLSRIVEPTQGRVSMRGRVASLLEVGTGFHPELSGRENIYLNGAILGMSRTEIRRRFDEIVAFSEVERFLDTPVKRYSSGMYVRLAFSVAAHLEPEILIVDEVLAVGDQEFQKKCLGKLQDVGQDGRTVIFVSHNLAAINQLCSSGVLLEGGRVSEAGPISGVVSAYLSRNNLARAEADLNDPERRPGSGGVRFSGARLLDAGGQPCQTFSLGDDLTLEFTLDFSRRTFPNPLQLSVLLRGSDGTKLCNLTDGDSGFALHRHGNQERLRVTLKDLRFYPDTYLLSLWAGSDVADQTHDLAEDCLGFDIVDGGRLTTRQLNRNAGLLFLTPEWEREQPGNAGTVALAGHASADS